MCAESQRRIDEFARFVHPRDGHKKIFGMIDAYLDESGIHDKASICVIAGYFGEQGPLRRLEVEWLKVLKRFSFPLADFHAKDLVKLPKYKPMLTALAKVIAQRKKVRPITSGIIVDDFHSFSLIQRRWFTGATLNHVTKKLIGGCPSKPYFVPFQNCLHRITDYAPKGAKVHFFFGLDRPFAEYAAALFAQIKLTPRPAFSTWKTEDRLGEPSFPLAKETPQLQAADLLVHLTYQHMCERWQAKNWNVHPSGLLRICLHNTLSTDDHVFQDREHLQDTLEKTYQHAGNWDGH